MQELLIKNGLIIDPSARREARLDILAGGGRICRVAAGIKERPGREVFDAAGLWVFPGFIDAHVHAREPGAEAGETIASAASAAAAGGITSMLLMPNTRPPFAAPGIIKKYRRLSSGSPVNVFFSAAATAARRGTRTGPLAALRKAGARAFTDDGAGIPRRLLGEVIEKAAAAGLPLLDHPERFDLSRGGVLNPGAARRLGLAAISPDAEILAVLADILAAAGSGRIHLQHLSLAASVAALRLAKAKGWPVTGETCPHYFTLSERDIRRADADFKMKPPLRAPADREAVLAGIADGTIDLIASDHAPHEGRLKAAGFKKAPFGVIGLETMAALCVTELVLKNRISRLRLAALLSANPAKLLKLKNKGSLRPGSDADITVLDPASGRRVPRVFLSRSSNSPFKGRFLRGWPALTVAGGRVIFRGAAAL